TATVFRLRLCRPARWNFSPLSMPRTDGRLKNGWYGLPHEACSLTLAKINSNPSRCGMWRRLTESRVKPSFCEGVTVKDGENDCGGFQSRGKHFFWNAE